MRVVIDTGVAISAVLLARSIPRQAFDIAVQSGRVLISRDTLAELDEVLRRPKFNKYVLESLRLEFLTKLVQIAEVVEITQPITACRDPDDDKFLALAVNGRATHLVTGDQDLLVLHPFCGIAIVPPQVFVTSAAGPR